MQFIDEPVEKAEQALLSELNFSLNEYDNVLWLVPGGSNITSALRVMSGIDERLTDKLTILLTDERFGPVGHADSNWRQLEMAGFDFRRAKPVPVLFRGLDFAATIRRYAENFEKASKSVDCIIGQLGMGPDGHTAGVLPHSPAADSKELAVGYTAVGFKRITLTPKALAKIDIAFLVAYGEAKKPALLNLRDKNLPLNVQPAQILKKISSAKVYNDQIGERI